ncbi:MAG TPA: SMC-Scp complex subunit ScpB [Gemmataceae bacterium]|nr:SMC-Scp complex subunit ScpB [Gemmataceae bacterium]
MHKNIFRRGFESRGRPDLPCNHRLPAIYRLWPEETEAIAGGELARDARLALVEAALMAADEPLTLRRLATVAGLTDAAEARRLVERLQALYNQDGTAFQVAELAGGFQLLTRVEFHPWLARLRRAGNEMRLSAAARETLAIVAYRQPITRADVEAIRGVQSGDMLHQLMEKGLVRIAGRDDSLGRPVLYGTTRKFLQLFGLRTLRDLPQAQELADPSRKRKKSEPELDT